MEYEGSNHIKNPEMQRVLLTHEVICRFETNEKLKVNDMLDMLGRGGRADIIGGPGKEGKEGREAVSLESLRPPQSSQNPYLHLTSSSLAVAHPSSLLFNGF